MEGGEWKKLCKWSEWDSTRNSSSQQSIILSPPSPALSSPTILVEYFKQCSTLDTIRAVWTSVHNCSSSQGRNNTQLWRKTHKTQSSVEVSTPPRWWRLMAGIGKQLVGTLAWSPHSRTPHQPRTDFKLVSHYPDLGLRIIVHISQKFQLLGARSAEPELLSYLRHSQHFASAADTCRHPRSCVFMNLWNLTPSSALGCCMGPHGTHFPRSVSRQAAGAGAWAENAGLRSVLVGSILKLSHRHNTFFLVARLFRLFTIVILKSWKA